MYGEFYHSKRDYARTMCVIDLAGMQRPYATQRYWQLDRLDGTQKGVVISSKLVIRYTQRPLIGFPLESKASRVKCSDRHGGASVAVGKILQTALYAACKTDL
ncbi:hypothetical protein ALC56_10792 [Trachymyrmex septentrionalis]|uniref:Uncharacterized protein n=1 Tax=Trachymyrmex septentrionalis TaxID=34720 RepID=A0A195F415_9HYME|nr:hypothetical protein ALC56_10792 [Trachymyrmex septentrionalis]